MSLPAGYSFDFKTELVSKTFHVSIFSVFGHIFGSSLASGFHMKSKKASLGLKFSQCSLTARKIPLNKQPSGRILVKIEDFGSLFCNYLLKRIDNVVFPHNKHFTSKLEFLS